MPLRHIAMMSDIHKYIYDDHHVYKTNYDLIVLIKGGTLIYNMSHKGLKYCPPHAFGY